MRHAILGVLVILVLARPAFAQSGGTFAVGADFSLRNAMSEHVGGARDVSLLWRWGHDRTGWGWHWGLNWYATDLDRSIGGRDTQLGELRVRPLMAGYGYSHVIGRTAITAAVLGGYAVTSLMLAPAANDAYHQRLGAQSVSGDASNTFVMKPEVGVWFDLTRKIGIHVDTGYMVARPMVTVNSTLGSDSARVRADMFMFKVGAAYSIF
jgi:hypothetical protein